MADTTVLWHSLPSLVSLTLKLYPRTGGEPVNGDGDTMTEDADVPGLYKATVTEALSGIYTARIHAGADLIGSYLVDLRDDTGAYDVADPVLAVGATTLAGQEVVAQVAGSNGEVTGFTSAALAQLAGVSVQLTQPFRGPCEPLVIVRGDDYVAADGRAIEITISGLDGNLDLEGASAKLTLQLGSNRVSFAATSVSRVGDDVVARFEPAAAETAGLRVSRNWRYDVQLTLANGRRITPVTEAEAHVLADYSE